MKKDAYYFPHFCNARNDRKIKRVLKDLGIEGYGIYFMLLEVLREQEGFKYPLSDIDLLADEFGTSESKLSVVISKYELFQIDKENNFFSIKQIYYLQPYIEKSKRAQDAANKRWNNANAYTNALQSESKSNADAMQVKESKVKESKILIDTSKKNFYDELSCAIESTIEDCMLMYFYSTNFERAIELLIMDYKSGCKTENELKHLAIEFNKHLELGGKLRRSLTDWANHFRWWAIDPNRVKEAAKNGFKTKEEEVKFNELIFGTNGK